MKNNIFEVIKYTLLFIIISFTNFILVPGSLIGYFLYGMILENNQI